MLNQRKFPFEFERCLRHLAHCMLLASSVRLMSGNRHRVTCSTPVIGEDFLTCWFRSRLDDLWCHSIVCAYLASSVLEAISEADVSGFSKMSKVRTSFSSTENF